jgi:hypothetical protein
MSTFAYGAITGLREDAEPNTSTTTAPPKLSTYVDILAALVPAEVLVAHATIMSFTTKTVGVGDDVQVSITDPKGLTIAFWALVGVTVVLYVLGHAGNWDKLDFLRVFIPPLAFVGWTLGTRPTAFDAAFDWTENTRYIAVVIGALVLGAAAAALAYGADLKQPDDDDAEHRDGVDDAAG